MKISRFEDLPVWKKAIELTKEVYDKPVLKLSILVIFELLPRRMTGVIQNRSCHFEFNSESVSTNTQDQHPRE
ncbi:four helix bundle protein [Patescibacteria group bacterium]|nr:four helix bundle protein [Patescibacteria group bacterium]